MATGWGGGKTLLEPRSHYGGTHWHHLENPTPRMGESPIAALLFSRVAVILSLGGDGDRAVRVIPLKQ